ncbi:MAG: biotin synthase BioB [Fusobacteriaceae bacterium]|jgi:biotin synthase|nr:biotin synthase BioB [Fusobacteriaceae bacterium]
MNILELKEKVLRGESIDREEALSLTEAPLEELCRAADDIRRHFCGNAFDVCAILDGKVGKCSEDCKYCAQSAHNHADIDCHPLYETDRIVEDAKYNADRGIPRYCIVTAGKKLPRRELEQVCESVRALRAEKIPMQICSSLGLLNREEYQMLRDAGVTRIHNNLETSERYFPSICTTHTFRDKVKAIQAAREAGMEICSGGIMGLGETMEDRIDLAFALRELDIRSIPVNFLNPIPGTPCEGNETVKLDEALRVIAVFRFINPKAFIKMAAGRAMLGNDKAVFQAGANATITGDFLTTTGSNIDSDLKLFEALGYELV